MTAPGRFPPTDGIGRGTKACAVSLGVSVRGKRDEADRHYADVHALN